MMKINGSQQGLLDFPFHTFILSIYPILFVFSRNLIYIQFLDTVRLLTLSVGFFSILLIGFRLVLKDWEKAGILSSLISCLFFSFGHVANGLIKWLYTREIIFNIDLLAWTWLILFLLLSFFVVRYKLPPKISQFINLISGILLTFSLVTILSTGDVNSSLNPQDIEKINELRGESDPEVSSIYEPEYMLPDIYYIVFDGYLRADYLDELFGFNNSSFINALEQRGFYIVSGSHSNYLNTNYSLNTSLNLTYFHDFPKDIFNKAKYNLYTNYVNEFLHKQGYQIVVFDSGSDDTNKQDADIFLTPIKVPEEENTINKFEQFFLRTTMGLLLFNDRSQDIYGQEPPDIVRSTVNQELTKRRVLISFALTHLPDFASKDGQFYLFSHIYSPHIPFLYGPNGEELRYHENLNLYWYDVEPENYVEYYNYQIDYLNNAVLNTIDSILSSTKKPVVIILQSDHGEEKYLDRDSPTSLGVRVRSSILNAIYFSDQAYEELYPTMTPVNTFRVVFNHWFGTQYLLLSDQVYFHEHSLNTGINEKPDFIDSCVQFNICLPEPTN